MGDGAVEISVHLLEKKKLPGNILDFLSEVNQKPLESSAPHPHQVLGSPT